MEEDPALSTSSSVPAADNQSSLIAEPPLIPSGNVGRYHHRDGNDDYRQAGDLFRSMSAEQKEQLFGNIKAAMEGLPIEIVRRQVEYLYRADPDHGIGVVTRMGLSARDLPGLVNDLCALRVFG